MTAVTAIKCCDSWHNTWYGSFPRPLTHLIPSWRVKSLDDRSGHDPVRPRSWQCWFICYGGIMTWSWWWSVMLVVFYINTCSLVLINRHSKKKEKKKLTYLKLKMCRSRAPCLNLLLLLLVPVPFQREVEFGHVAVMTWPCHSSLRWSKW